MTPTSTFIVDLVSPLCYDPLPAEGETLLVAPESLAISISDDFSGVNWDLVDAENFTITVNEDTASFADYEISDGRIVFRDLEISGQGEITIWVNDIPDSPDYEYCPPNYGDCSSSFLLVLEPEYVYFPDTICPPCDTILIPFFVDSLGPTPIEEAEFAFRYDPQVIKPIGIVLDGGLMSEWSITDTELDTSVATISASLSGPALTREMSGALLYVRAYVPCAAWGGDYCPLQIETASFNGGFPRVESGNGFLVVDWRWTTWFTELRLNSLSNPGGDLVLAIGGDEYSTDMYDATSDLVILPHVPGTVHGHLVNDDPDYFWITQLRRDMKDLTPPNRWFLPTSAEDNGIIKWNPSTLPEGKFYMNHTIDMKLDSFAYYGLNDTLIIDWLTPPLGIDTTCLSVGWNLLSLPAMPPRYHSEEVFSFSPVGVYRYLSRERTYSETGRMEKGEGYWVYSTRDTCMKFGGILLEDYQRLIYRGWNMLGSISEPIFVDDICTSPSDLILPGSIYEYNAETGSYIEVDTLRPGKGYWFMVIEDGVISVPSTGVFCRPFVMPGYVEVSGRIHLAGITLEFGTQENAESTLDPLDSPIPPASPGTYSPAFAFVRDGLMLRRDISDEPYWELNIGAEVNADFDVDDEYILISPDGREVEIEDNLLLTSGIWKLKAALPEAIDRLSVNPNPFNSSLNIDYNIDGKGEIMIYDTAGRVVSSFDVEGRGSLLWNADHSIPSGIYTVQIGDNVEKAILMK